MRIALCALAAASGVTALQAEPLRPVAYIERSGVIACSEDAATSCELSAVAWIRQGKSGQLLFGNDKPPKSSAESSVFALPFDGKQGPLTAKPAHFASPPFSRVTKIEGLSVTPDGRHVVATTAFDRFKQSDSSFDSYDVMLTWPAATPEKARVIASSSRDGVESSLALRARLMKAVQKAFGEKMDYFKVEGLALLPGERILFGIREAGESHTRFEYRVALFEGRYRIGERGIELDDSAEIVLAHDFSALSGVAGRPIGVSSIEYDPATKRLYLLTSFEDNAEKRLGAYLWVMSADAGKAALPELVRTTDGAPFELPHKGEGLAPLPGGRALIIHDDDRYLTRVRLDSPGGSQSRTRRSQEAPYDLICICAGDDRACRRNP